jgi:phage baseplate assembly protein V
MSYRRGIVSAVDATAHRVRVRFPDRQDLESPWLDVLVRDTHTAKDYGLPSVDAQVAVLLDERGEAGCVVGSLYSSADPPTASDDKIRRLDAADGTRIEYDAGTHELRITLVAGGIVHVGDDTLPVALAPLVAKELAKITTWATHVHPTALGPSGPPTPALEPFESTESSVLKAQG